MVGGEIPWWRDDTLLPSFSWVDLRKCGRVGVLAGM